MILGSAVPEKMFDRPPMQNPAQVLSYSVSPDNKWLVINGLTAAAGAAPVPFCHLWSLEKRQQQHIEAHAACFALSQLENKATKSVLFAFTATAQGQVRQDAVHCFVVVSF